MEKEKFGVGELIYDPKIYDKVNPATGEDLEFYYNLAKKQKGKVLELCCGTGRLTIPLKEREINITGLDYTKSMLNEAKKKADKKNLNIDFILGDMKNLKLSEDEKFDMIFIPFNSLQNTYTIEDVSKVFSSVSEYLGKDGIFVFDIFNPSIHLMVNGEKEYHKFKEIGLDDGKNITISEKGKYDSAAQIFRVNWKHKIGNKEFNEKLDMRCFFPLEMDLHIRYNNFIVVEKYGDFDYSQFNSDSMKQIYICKKK